MGAFAFSKYAASFPAAWQGVLPYEFTFKPYWLNNYGYPSYPYASQRLQRSSRYDPSAYNITCDGTGYISQTSKTCTVVLPDGLFYPNSSFPTFRDTAEIVTPYGLQVLWYRGPGNDASFDVYSPVQSSVCQAHKAEYLLHDCCSGTSIHDL